MSTHDEDQENNSLVHRHRGRQFPDSTIIDLIEPKPTRHNDEEERELDDNGLHQDDVVNPVDGERSTNSLECLPPEQLEDREASDGTTYMRTKKPYLDQSPCEEGGYQESQNIQGQAGDLGMTTILPICRQQIDPTNTLSGQPVEIGTEFLCVEDLVASPRRRDDMCEEGSEAIDSI